MLVCRLGESEGSNEMLGCSHPAAKIETITAASLDAEKNHPAYAFTCREL